ncbi:hypothetical protein BXY70_2401 [Roseovarius halotolerans]|uniref:NADH dehydrogenase subunit E n=1 Tax=Roseovarius halotolerans TaxID=505353 RepID=A0A1X6Z8G7_9RHOB|nr:DUF5333 domain-containing protein [Roseovarius halotolerans]RKT30412.1 hypothetical protein BXY70_2401 [Roseovarius halotolerans]SLN44106.1 hypothetical protein ROH8110_02298 [Roseovarius halotolerans]
MTKLKALALITMLSATAATGQAATQKGLPSETDINAGLLTVAVADKIRRACGDISARFFTARSYVSSLKEMATERGYSDAEIDAYINDDVEKARMREKRNEYFKARGASNLDPASLCTLGRAEIQKQSQIGLLLRAK